DVKLTTLPMGMTQEEARMALRRERRVEFALEGIYYWADIKRWEIGGEIYPMEIRGSCGGLVEIRYPNGYQLPKDRYFPIPDSERSLNPNLVQNPGW
ncbi:MAG TPA: RagB/SusD family nutrient uptake outer membrane protein, partial [Lunatimonas sp.]|nr:RagB/SusD family nutrient uptake outer membrane protein [Lunatimonas sp.]